MIYNNLKEELLPDLKLTSLKQVYAFTLNQLVLINGILGYVDFIGEEETVLMDNQGRYQTIKNSDIKEIYSNDIVRSKDDSVFYVKLK